MKLGRLIVNYLYRDSYRSTLKRRKLYPPRGVFNETNNIPYYEGDDNPQHSYDVYLTKENKSNICVIDIHGGAYIFGEHRDNYSICYEFLQAGFDVVNMDYLPNDSTRSMKDIVNDLVAGFNHLFAHLKDYGLENRRFVITGDSAGGHLAMLMTELLLDEKYAAELGYKLPKADIVACVANCPVYDFAHLKEGWLSNSGAKRMFGPNHKEPNYFTSVCPRTHIDSLTCPLFASTCTKDFLREQSMILQEDMKNKNIKFELFDIESKKKGIGHVHNVLHPEYEESKRVNEAMMKFIYDCAH